MGKTPITEMSMTVEMPDGSIYRLNCLSLAWIYFRKNKDTYIFFINDSFEFLDRCTSNLDWEDVKHIAHIISDPKPVDFQEGWLNGCKSIGK